MKVRFLIVSFIFCCLLLGAGFISPVHADDPGYDGNIGKLVTQNCATIQTSLNDLRQRDLSSRVAHVYVYEFLLRRTSAFSQRLAYNHLPNADIDADNQTIQKQLDKFKDDYNQYDDNLVNLSKKNCRQDPEGFYNALTTVRGQRAGLAADITNIEASWTKLISDIAAVKLPSSTNSTAGGNQ